MRSGNPLTTFTTLLLNQRVLFAVVETPCADGKYKPVTYVTKKGLDYIRKLLRNDGYYDDDLVTE